MTATERINLLAAVLAVVVATAALYYSSFYRRDSTKLVLLDVETAPPYGIDFAMINDGNTQSLITRIDLHIPGPFRTIAAQPIKDIEMSPQVPAVLLPGEIKLFQIRFSMDVDHAGELGKAQRKDPAFPECLTQEVNGNGLGPTSCSTLALSVSAMDSNGETHQESALFQMSANNLEVSSASYSSKPYQLIDRSRAALPLP